MTGLYPMTLAAGVFLVAASLQAQERAAETGSMRFTRIYADSTGASHFADAELALTPLNPGRGIPPTPASLSSAATGLIFLCPHAGASVDWHPAPRRQFNIITAGEYEVEVSDGEVRRFGPGSVLRVEDTQGRGHRTRVSGDGRACFAALPLADADSTGMPPSDPSSAGMPRRKAAGWLTPVGGPLGPPSRLEAGHNCIVDVRQGYDISGTLSGSVEIDFRILVDGPCGSPPGTFAEEWIAHGSFTGTKGGAAVSARFSYTARVHAGGDVHGRIVLGRGLEGEVRVRGNFADGRLSYEGWIDDE